MSGLIFGPYFLIHESTGFGICTNDGVARSILNSEIDSSKSYSYSAARDLANNLWGLYLDKVAASPTVSY